MTNTAPVPVRLALVDGNPRESRCASALRIAFATSDQHTINQHFGTAESFAVFVVSADDMSFSEAISLKASARDGNEDKLADRISALAGCAAVYCCAIGASAIGQLKACGTEPLKAAPGTPIRAQIALLQEQMRTEPPRWLARAGNDAARADRFAEMASEGWIE